MISPDINVEDLSQQLHGDGVALQLDNEHLHRDLVSAVEYGHLHGENSLGIAVVENTPARVADLRDLAQELAVRTELDTVVVKSPGAGAVVSVNHSRAEIELAQEHLFATPDYRQGVEQVIDAWSTDMFSWVPVAVVAVVVVVAVIAEVLIRVKRSH